MTDFDQNQTVLGRNLWKPRSSRVFCPPRETIAFTKENRAQLNGCLPGWTEIPAGSWPCRTGSDFSMSVHQNCEVQDRSPGAAVSEWLKTNLTFNLQNDDAAVGASSGAKSESRGNGLLSGGGLMEEMSALLARR